MKDARKGMLGILILSMLPLSAGAREAFYFRSVSPSQKDGASGGGPATGNNTVVSFASQPGSVTAFLGLPLSTPAPSLANASGSVSYALQSSGTDISDTLPSLCAGLGFARPAGTVSGTPTANCTLTALRLVATDSAGKAAVSEPFSIQTAAPSLTLQRPGDAVGEGAWVDVQATTNLPSPTWSVGGLPAGSASTVSGSGLLRMYAADIDHGSVFSVVLTASGGGTSKSAPFTLSVAPSTASLAYMQPVHSGAPFHTTALANANFPGAWMKAGVSDDVSFSFAPPDGKTASVDGTAPVNTGSAPVRYQIGAAFVASDAPPGAVPAMASATNALDVYPALGITGVDPAYSVAEGEAFALAPVPAQGSLIGTPSWTVTNLPSGLAFNNQSGAVSGTVAGGSAAAAAERTVEIVLKDSADASAAGTASKAFQLSLAAKALLSATPNPLTATPLSLGASATCTPVTLTNGGSLAATSPVLTVASGAADFEACTPPATATPICGASLAYQGSCLLGVKLISTTAGTKTGSATITTQNASPVTLPLTGVVSPPVVLYPFTSWTFTNCGKSGASGPSLAECNASYGSTPWGSGSPHYANLNGGQLWTVPKTGNYRITAIGAAGSNGRGGKGASLTSTYALNQGDKLLLVVGQIGANNWDVGGGGTFVTLGDSFATATPLLVAGGGAGYLTNVGAWSDASLTTSGGSFPYTPGSNFPAGSRFGGTDGEGGGPTQGVGGGGFLTNGLSGGRNLSSGKAFRNGAAGGSGPECGNLQGGFGGGGGPCAGGGGGYSGGSGGGWNSGGTTYSGGGGGSYSSKAITSPSVANTGNGSIQITFQ